MPLLCGRTTALVFSEVPEVAFCEALSLPGMVEEVLRTCGAPTALCCDDVFILFSVGSGFLVGLLSVSVVGSLFSKGTKIKQRVR